MNRQRIFGALFAHILLAQVFTFIDLGGVRWSSPFTVVIITSTIALLLGFTFWSYTPRGEGDVTSLGWTGPVAWVIWASLYYLVASRAVVPHALPAWYVTRFEPRLTLVPATVLIYIGVHPLSMLPYLSLATRPAVLKHFAGHLTIVAASVLCWLAFPLALPRHDLPAANGSIGVWALGVLQHNDPVVNCLPSTHCSVALYSALGLRKVDRRLGVWALLTASAISLSTLLTEQHYLLDVLLGLALGFLVSRVFHRT